MSGKFEKKNVLITGATSGIGSATAKLFAEEDANVVVVGRDEKRGIELVNRITEDNGNAVFVQCDVTSEDSVKRLGDILSESYDTLDVLFNNAGIMLPSSEIERMSIEDWDMTFNTNIRGMFLVTRICKAFLKKGSSIINNASIAGLQHYVAGRSYAYSASKAAVIQLSHQMAKNYASDGIRVNCICPGIINTPILGDRDRTEYAKRIPLGYVAEPDEVGKSVLFLASDEAAYITGVVLPIDGGASL